MTTPDVQSSKPDPKDYAGVSAAITEIFSSGRETNQDQETIRAALHAFTATMHGTVPISRYNRFNDPSCPF